MGFISAIVSLLKAIPSLERLFLKIADGLKEQQASNRRDEKYDQIDARIAAASRGMRPNEEVQQRQHADESSRVSESSVSRPELHQRGDEDNR